MLLFSVAGCGEIETKDNITAADNNETNIPVTWEDNDTVKEIRKWRFAI